MAPKNKAWRTYQENAADFFRRLGLSAEVEAKVEGVRGSHVVDVLIRGTYLGIPFTWLVECKAWQTSIPKEKVMALAAIIQDIGADRAFLLSESGFQSGALRAAEKTNITLSSLADLEQVTTDQLQEAILGSLHWRIRKSQDRLRSIKRARYDDHPFPPTLWPLTSLMLIEQALMDAVKGEFPSPYFTLENQRREAHTMEEMLTAAREVVASTEAWEPPTEG
ncbi:MAG TPA: restriction endonuclease [Variovorax sp.]